MSAEPYTGEATLNARQLAWLADRLTLADLPAEQRAWFENLADELWRALARDPEVHEGCIPHDALMEAKDDLRGVERELQDAELRVEQAESVAAAAGPLGYRTACADARHRIEAMELEPEAADTPDAAAVRQQGFDQARRRMAEGLSKLRDRGPKGEA